MKTDCYLHLHCIPRFVSGTAEGEGLVGPRPYHFFAPPPPLFALKRKIIKIKKTWNKFFSVYIPLYSLYFRQFQMPGILWGSCTFRGNCALGPTCPLIKRHALATPSFRSAACFVLPAPAEFFISFIRGKEENYQLFQAKRKRVVVLSW